MNISSISPVFDQQSSSAGFGQKSDTDTICHTKFINGFFHSRTVIVVIIIKHNNALLCHFGPEKLQTVNSRLINIHIQMDINDGIRLNTVTASPVKLPKRKFGIRSGGISGAIFAKYSGEA